MNRKRKRGRGLFGFLSVIRVDGWVGLMDWID